MRRFFPNGGLFACMLLAAVMVSMWVASASAEVSGERKVALIIGNGAYRNASQLTNPTHDAELVAQTLTKLGFTLVGGAPVLDADKPTMENAIREFGRQLRDGAVGLFYYSGHGIQVGGVNYLIPVTADISRDSDVKYELVDIGFVLDEMTNAGNRLNIVILDACRNNPFGRRGMRSVSAGLGQVMAPAGTVIGYATQPDNVAADGNGQNSPYTTALANALQKPGIDLFGMFNEVGLEVKQVTGGQQQPWVSASPIEGQFYFAGAPTAQTSADPDALFWDSVKNSAGSGDFVEYLKRFPDGQFAGLAKRKLAAECDVLASPPGDAARAESAETACRAMSGDPKADFLLGSRLEAQGRHAEAVAALRRAAEKDNAAAAAMLGALYEGNGLTRDDAEAVRWQKVAASRGIVSAEVSLGAHLAQGTGVKRDASEAVTWYKKAADQGDVKAQEALGLAYSKGQGVSHDDAEAMRWFKKAAEQGSVVAQARLGEAYGEGVGVSHDDAEAVRWYKKAADQGDAKSQYNLGWCYQFGLGLSPDPRAAAEWYRKAASQGLAKASDALASLTGSRE